MRKYTPGTFVNKALINLCIKYRVSGTQPLNSIYHIETTMTSGEWAGHSYMNKWKVATQLL